MTSVTIRLAELPDAEAMAALFCQLGHPATGDEVAARLEVFAQHGEEALVAEIGGRVVGVTALSMMRVLHKPIAIGRMSVLVVEEGLRGQGIGRALVATAERRLRSRGCGEVEVTSNMKRERAHAFYEGLGYERISYRFRRKLD